MPTATQTAVIFDRKDVARRVSRRLRDFGVLSRVLDREVVIEVTKHGAERDRDLAIRIASGEA